MYMKLLCPKLLNLCWVLVPIVVVGPLNIVTSVLVLGTVLTRRGPKLKKQHLCTWPKAIPEET